MKEVAKALVMVVCLLGAPAMALAQDVVEVSNGDRFTGDVRGLEKGRLSFRTASAGAGHQRPAGTLSIIWTEVTRLTSTQELELELRSGELFVGTVSSPLPGKFVVRTASGPTRVIDRQEVISLERREAGFRGRTTGSVDFGLSYASAENARTYTLTAAAAHRSPQYKYETEAGVDSWLSARDDVERLTRNKATLDMRRRLANRWYAVAKFVGQQDEELGLDARFLAGGGVGRRLVQSSSARFLIEGGVDYDAEKYNTVGSYDHSAEVFGDVIWEWFEPGHSTEVKLVANFFVALDENRQRIQFDGTLRRDIFWSMYWSANVSQSFDSEPPAGLPRGTFGLSFGLGWTF